MDFKLHEVDWTDAKVSRFWDSFSKLSHLQYFGEQAGRKVLKIAKSYISLSEPILDYGSGKGFMIRYLLDAGAKNVSGCDFSEDSVSHVSKEFGFVPNFRGCTRIQQLPSPLPGDHYHAVFFMETIEHLLDDHYQATLKELSRLVKKGGYVIVTTRNNENLNNLKVICPDCGALFHRVQHVRSFSQSSLSQAMATVGFSRVSCQTHDLGRSEFSRWIFELYRRLRGRQYNNPNLIYIGRKV